MSTETVLTDFQIDNIAASVSAARASEQNLRFARAIEQAVLQSDQVQAWKRDAERYQYLRGYKGHKATGVLLKGILFNGQEPSTRVDEVMDAAMEQKT